MFIKFQNSFKVPRTYCNFLQDILNEWDYELAWHENKHEETNYCAFEDNRKLKVTKDCIFIYAKSGLKLLQSL